MPVIFAFYIGDRLLGGGDMVHGAVEMIDGHDVEWLMVVQFTLLFVRWEETMRSGRVLILVVVINHFRDG